MHEVTISDILSNICLVRLVRTVIHQTPFTNEFIHNKLHISILSGEHDYFFTFINRISRSQYCGGSQPLSLPLVFPLSYASFLVEDFPANSFFQSGED